MSSDQEKYQIGIIRKSDVFKVYIPKLNLVFELDAHTQSEGFPSIKTCKSNKSKDYDLIMYIEKRLLSFQNYDELEQKIREVLKDEKNLRRLPEWQQQQRFLNFSD